MQTARSFKAFGGQVDLTRISYELRYTDGSLFLDRCGTAYRELGKLGWLPPRKDASPQGADLIKYKGDIKSILSLSNKSLGLHIGQALQKGGLSLSDADAFAKDAEEVTAKVVSLFDIGRISRIGVRMFLEHEVKNLERSQKILSRLKVVPLKADVLKSIYPEGPTTFSFVLRGEGSAHDTRYAIDTIKIMEEREDGENKSERYFIQLDVDCSRDNPKSVLPHTFIKDCMDRQRDAIEMLTEVNTG